MEDNDLFFASIHDMDFEALSQRAAHDAGDDEEALEDDPHPERFYLACQKALTRLKQYASSSPSF